MEMETVLPHLFQLYVILDLQAMDKETAFLQSLKLHQLVQVNTTQMEKETVFQTSIEKYRVLKDSQQIRKEIAFGSKYLHTHHTIHLFQKLTKFSRSLLLQSQLHLCVQLVSIQMDLETVLLHQFQ